MILVLLVIPSIRAQDKFFPGYIILNNGDTLTGVVRDRDLSRGVLYKKIRFREGKARTKRFSPYQIKGYGIENAEYESMWFEEYSEFFRFYYYNRYGVGEKEFMRVLEKGPLSCYYREYIDFDSGYPDGYYLYKREGEDYFERATQGILGLKKKRLAEYFRDCPSLVEQIQSGEIKNPLEVVSFYNNNCF